MIYGRFFLILLFFYFLNSVQSQDWQWQKIDGEAISVLAPATFKHKEVEMDTDIGQLAQHTYFIQDSLSESGNYLYTLSYYDYPEGSFHSDSSELKELLLDMTVEGSIEALNGELLYAGELEIWGFPAKIWRISFQDGKASVKNQMILVGDRVITMQVFTTQKHAKNDQIDQYLKSIKVKSKT
jgi:hypothetical protein